MSSGGRGAMAFFSISGEKRSQYREFAASKFIIFRLECTSIIYQNINDILYFLKSAKYFSVYDLATGFHHIKIDLKKSHKTVFSTRHGYYEFDRKPFGLKTALATFQRLMDLILTGLIRTKLFVYLFVVVIYATTLEEHEIKFNNLAEGLRKAHFHLQLDKCEFSLPELGYYRRFIHVFLKISKIFNQLLKKRWTKVCEGPPLQRPGFSYPFIFTTDASEFAMGGILSQGKIGKDMPIVAYASRSISDTEKKY